MNSSNSISKMSLTYWWVALLSFLVAALMGVYQVAERSGLFPAIESQEVYFGSVSTHGVLMAFVLTTFVIMATGYYWAESSLKRPVWGGRGMAKLAFLIALIGVLLAAFPLLTGQASVLFTFYPPLMAHPLFYIGATLLVVGSWVWCLQMIMSMVSWKKDNPGAPVPLVMFGTTANAIMWLWTSLGVAAEVLFQLIPWSLGWIDTVEVGLARTLFSWTLHAIVYFWLFPAYIAYYTLVPKAAGGRLFSDEMGRIAFIMLLVISVPIGMHHLYMDPFQGAGWKFLTMIGTFMVALPTLFTGFTVLASLELSGRLRGGRGLFGWIGALPWKDPLVLACGLSMFMLILGGFGGLVNASYSMNAMVHNTQWVTGHFHLIFGGTVVIMYMGIAYHEWPKMTGRALAAPGMARMQLWLWTIGMFVLTMPWHLIGLQGQPRRISSTVYDSPLVDAWAPSEAIMLVGGLILFLSALMLIVVLLRTHSNSETADAPIAFAEPVHPVTALPSSLNGFKLWNIVILFYIVINYGYPIGQFFLMPTYGAFPWGI